MFFEQMSEFLSLLLTLVALFGGIALSYHVFRVFLVNGVKCQSKERVDGKTVIITGGSSGVGKYTALELAKRGGRIIIAARDIQKGELAVREIKEKAKSDSIFFHHLNLASKASIQKFAEEILKSERHISILVLNAGVMVTPYQLTEDGFEFQFGVNHLGHFFLTHLLQDRLRESAPSRVVVVSALAHVAGSLDFSDMMWRKRYNRVLSYCRSKLANVMFARELARRMSCSNVTVCSIHPGVVKTELGRYLMSGWLVLLKPLAVLLMYLFFKTARCSNFHLLCCGKRD